MDGAGEVAKPARPLPPKWRRRWRQPTPEAWRRCSEACLPRPPLTLSLAPHCYRFKWTGTRVVESFWRVTEECWRGALHSMGSSGLSTALTSTNSRRRFGGGANRGQSEGERRNRGFRDSGICSSAGLRGRHRRLGGSCALLFRSATFNPSSERRGNGEVYFFTWCSNCRIMMMIRTKWLL
jgi:hypothetical protein